MPKSLENIGREPHILSQDRGNQENGHGMDNRVVLLGMSQWIAVATRGGRSVIYRETLHVPSRTIRERAHHAAEPSTRVEMIPISALPPEIFRTVEDCRSGSDLKYLIENVVIGVNAPVHGA